MGRGQSCTNYLETTKNNDNVNADADVCIRNQTKDQSAEPRTKIKTVPNISGASKSPWAEVSPVLTI